MDSEIELRKKIFKWLLWVLIPAFLLYITNSYIKLEVSINGEKASISVGRNE